MLNWDSIIDVATTISNTNEKINIEENILKDVPLAPLCSYRCGGDADLLAAPTTLGELRQLLEYSTRQGLAVTILGGGTNVLISDRGVRGLVILTSRLCAYHVRGTVFCAQSGLLLDKAINVSIEHSLSGLELLGGLPGTVGGAIWGNASAQGFAISELVEWIDYLQPDGTIRRIQRDDPRFSYKNSPFKGTSNIIYEIAFRLQPNKNTSEARLLKEQSRRNRRETGQYDFPSAGCMFKNPHGKTAGTLIDEAGLKGMVLGGAQISQNHANFFINRSRNSTSQEIFSLSEIARKKIEERFGIQLEREIILLGEWPMPV